MELADVALAGLDQPDRGKVRTKTVLAAVVILQFALTEAEQAKALN